MTDPTRKVLISPYYGSFSVSRKAIMRLRELGLPEAIESDLSEDRDMGYYLFDTPRDDPRLIQAIEELGIEESTPPFHREHDPEDKQHLKIVEIPADVEWYVEQDGETGCEWVAEKHRTWS